jgi:putative transposase
MKVVVQVRLIPDPSAAEALEGTLRLCNEGANLASETAWRERCFRNYDLRRHVSCKLKALGLSAQAAQHAIKKAADAYKVDRKKVRHFRPLASQPFDDRCLSWQLGQGTVSIWTVAGRLKAIPFVCTPWQEELLASRQGESDLVYRDGK